MTSLLRPLHERFGVRLPALTMVLICVAVVLWARQVRQREFVASAITEASATVLTAALPSVVDDVLVTVGQEVRAGDTLVRLGSRELYAERDALLARIRRVVREAELARLELSHDVQKERRERLVLVSEAQRELAHSQAERDRRAAEAEAVAALHDEAERLLGAGLMDPFRAREQAVAHATKASQHGELARQAHADDERLALLRRALAELGAEGDLERATAELYAAELDVLAAERARIEARIDTLVIKAPTDGVVTELVARGSTVLAGTPLAHVAPRAAEHVVAYVATSDSPPTARGEVEFAVLLGDGRRCAGRGIPHAQAVAVPKPAQLAGFAQLESWGFPVRLALPDACRLPIGQLVELSFEAP